MCSRLIRLKTCIVLEFESPKDFESSSATLRKLKVTISPHISLISRKSLGMRLISWMYWRFILHKSSNKAYKDRLKIKNMLSVNRFLNFTHMHDYNWLHQFLIFRRLPCGDIENITKLLQRSFQTVVNFFPSSSCMQPPCLSVTLHWKFARFIQQLTNIRLYINKAIHYLFF